MPRKGQKLSPAQRRKISEGQRRAYLQRAKQPLASIDRKPCSKCRRVKPISEFSPIKKKLKSGGYSTLPGSWCKSCQRESSKRTRERLKREGLLRERSRRYAEKEDPERRRARKREWENARRREEGRPVSKSRKLQHLKAGSSLDPAPLLQFLERELHQIAQSHAFSDGSGRLAQISGLSTRRLYDLLHGKTQKVPLSTVDRILTGLGMPHMLPILYPED